MEETSLFDLIVQGGLLMVPILLSSIIAMTIITERMLALRTEKIAPSNLVARVWGWVKSGHLNKQRIKELQQSSPLGRVLAVGIVNMNHGRELMKESIEEVATHEIHEMERYLNLLGSIAAISPLLGLLGTVIGMIEVFSTIVLQGTGNAGVLAGGISKALITTASGLTVAIPALFFHRFLVRRVDELAVYIEQEAIKLVDVMHGDREGESNQGSIGHRTVASSDNKAQAPKASRSRSHGAPQNGGAV